MDNPDSPKLQGLMFAVALFVGITGCKPKDVTLSGQVFIVTKGAANIPMGDVEVCLISKPEALTFLTAHKGAIANGIESRRQAFQESITNATKASADLSAATADYVACIDDYTKFIESDVTRTNTDYRETRSNRDAVLSQLDAMKPRLLTLRQQILQITGYSDATESLSGDLSTLMESIDKRGQLPSSFRVANTLEFYDEPRGRFLASADQAIDSYTSRVKDIEEKLLATKSEVERIAERRRRDAESSADLATSNMEAARTELTRYPRGSDYFENFSPTVLTKSRTDVTGKFSLTYHLGGVPLSIYAHAERLVGDETEQYFWLVDAPTNFTESFILSNARLVSVGPDGYSPMTLK